MNAYNPTTSALTKPTADTARILVIRFKHIGDVLLTSVLCNTLKQTFPKARVDFLIQQTSADLFVNHPYINKVIAISPAQQKNPFKYWQLIRRITNDNYDLVVDAQSTAKSELVSMLARKNAICIGRKKRRRGFFYTHKVDTSQKQAGNKIEERLSLLEPLRKMGFDVKRYDQMEIAVPDATKARYRQALLDRGVDLSRPIFAVSVSAKLPHKKWRVDYLHHVMDHCVEVYGAQIVLNAGSDTERADALAFMQASRHKESILHDVSTFNLMDLSALLSLCDLYVGNEGGPRHIAQAVGVPSVSIFSPSAKKAEWLPSSSRLHQGVEWDDLVDTSLEEKARVHRQLEVGSAEYFELYYSITPQPVIELIDDVACFAGIQRLDKVHAESQARGGV
ncbi:glycosyltransferase family 9 protein [Arenicella xantha]|uniref:Heptosyltransferase-2 n=1 Tax=Arenicella xantha TaxID=644221 RepID=A0A395JTJ1_9GAMM|nr:glycosyltransferase family 9 protein [Arenicella xantha]RBP53652.1 heptosyltransferase-2 [Arenicella xantha]